MSAVLYLLETAIIAPILGNDSTRGFSDAVVGDGFAIGGTF